MVSRDSIRNYAIILSGSAGRLVLSLVYFVIVANSLSLQEFGVFAAVSGTGIVLSRLLAFGFVSPLFRTATARQRLTGTYLAGFAALAALSLPLVIMLGLALHQLVFTSDIGRAAFLFILLGEVIGWRLLEIVAIVNNGLKRYTIAAQIVIAGSIIRTIAAILFWWIGQVALADWALTFFLSNLAAAIMAGIVALPRMRWHWRPALYARRMHDAVTACAAEMAFYMQAELDKVLVLSLAGARIAGLYAISMRIIDLTAMPVRAFNQMMVQSVIASRGQSLAGRLVMTEIGIMLVSLAGFAAIIFVLWLQPGLLGRNVQNAAILFPFMLAIPAFRNLIEYHSELLYAREMSTIRILLLLLMVILKTALLWLLLVRGLELTALALWLNLLFAVLYLVSLGWTYRFLLRGK